jgi:hypothetical protein
MGADRLMRTPCTVLRRAVTGEDEFGDSIKGSTKVETRCSLQLGGGVGGGRLEHVDHGEISDEIWALYLPIGTEIDTGDAVIGNGKKYELVGDPWNAEEGSRAMWHVEATVRRTAAPGDDA